MTDKTMIKFFQIKVILPIILLAIWWFGLSYLFGGGWSGVGNSLYILIDLIFSIWISYYTLKKIFGLDKLKQWNVYYTIILIFILSNIPYWLLLIFNPF